MSDHDTEKGIPSNGNGHGATTDSGAAYASEGERGPWTTRLVDSFKRDPNAHVTKSSERAVSKGGFDHEAAAMATANSGLARKLQGRHLQMIAIGGSIGRQYPFLSKLFMSQESTSTTEMPLGGPIARQCFLSYSSILMIGRDLPNHDQ